MYVIEANEQEPLPYTIRDCLFFSLEFVATNHHMPGDVAMRVCTTARWTKTSTIFNINLRAHTRQSGQSHLRR
jgi:hypothetical protein